MLIDCSSTVCIALVHHACPALGALLLQFLFLAPLKSFSNVLKTESLGVINPYPYPILFVLSTCWLLYGFKINDYYISCPQFLGIVAPLCFTMIGFAYGSKRQKRVILILTVSSLFLVFVASVLSFLVFKDKPYSKWPIGAITMLFKVSFYASPLSTIVKVIKTKNSSSIHRNLTLASVFNCSLWVAYGLLKGPDYVILAPNLLSLFFSLMQFFLRMIYPARPNENILGEESMKEEGKY